MGFEAETSVADREFVDLLADERKVGEKSKRADQTGIISFGLTFAEPALGEVVNVDQIGSGAVR